MKKTALFTLLLFLSALTAIPINTFSDTGEKRNYILWDAAITDYIKQDLWQASLAYDAGHSLMVPMHAAFSLNEQAWQLQFADLFRRFTKNMKNYAIAENERLSKLHFLYLGSCYLNLSAGTQNSALSDFRESLYRLLIENVTDLWLFKPAWQWGRKAFGGGMKERIDWKLGSNIPWKKYYKAFIDEELFLFAIAGELSYYQTNATCPANEKKLANEIRQYAYKVFRKAVVLQKGGEWLFQPGVWSDHPDFLYAGHSRKAPGLKASRIKVIAEDVSHSHRLPLWLKSIEKAFPSGSEQNQYFAALLSGLDKQFFEKVVVKPTNAFPSYRTTNYMDGWNGIYRYDYGSLRSNYGYGPFELSGTITLGWWSFLGSEKSSAMYKALAAAFPLRKDVMALYAYPQKNWTNSQCNLRELIVRLASKL
ncbi:MAG TPA: hypothetical protein DCY84_03250 [Firmicutes bacterium]|nr:hypothetical protein [Bacillota bacterium]